MGHAGSNEVRVSNSINSQEKLQVVFDIFILPRYFSVFIRFNPV